MKAIKELGFKKGFSFIMSILLRRIFNFLILPPFKVLFLRLFGSKIGQDTIINQIKFANLYRRGFKGLKIGYSCFLADEVLLDLADNLIIGNHVTLAYGVLVFTHTNVGYHDHPLQKYYPSFRKQVKIGSNSFIGAGAIILPGVTIGENAVVAAGSIVNKDVPSHTLVAGTPAQIKKKLP